MLTQKKICRPQILSCIALYLNDLELCVAHVSLDLFFTMLGQKDQNVPE